MNLILKQILIVGVCFLIILWFQNKEDVKNKKERTSFYDKYKFPLLVSSIVGLILNLQNILYINENCDTNSVTEIAIITPNNNFNANTNDMTRPFIHPPPIKTEIADLGDISGVSGMTRFGGLSKLNHKDLSDQLIFTELPDF